MSQRKQAQLCRKREVMKNIKLVNHQLFFFFLEIIEVILTSDFFLKSKVLS